MRAKSASNHDVDPHPHGAMPGIDFAQMRHEAARIVAQLAS
jgi:hypothetical protein